MAQATLLKYSSSVARLLTSVSLVIPAYNDESTVGRLLADSDILLRGTCRDYEILVINDGSTDDTRSIIERAASKNSRIKVINHPVNKGFGSTIRELYLTASKDLIFSLPGDYQYAPKELLAMANGLERNDFVIGRRINRNDPPRRKVQSHIYNTLLRFVYGHRHTDVNSIKLFRRTILNRVTLRSHTPFVDAELCIRAERAGYKVVEIPIKHLPRLSQGASGGKLSVIWETFSDLFKMRSTF